ncbi:MAG: flippase-like domain-containing protein [Nitrospirales bacterium]
MLKLIFLILGFAALVGMIFHIGLAPILHTLSQLSPWAITVILLPMILVYALEAFGWQLTLGSHARLIGFPRLFGIRMAGESVNVTTPTAYVGGEPLKAYLLKQYGVPMVDGLASVVTAKTTMTLAQVFFILLGLALAFWIIGDSEGSGLAMVISLGVLIFGVGLFVLLQRYGIGMGILAILRACRIKLAFFEARESKLLELDATIRNFYSHHRRRFFIALGTFFVAWLAETLEVYAILFFLNVGVDVWTAISIAALTVFIKGGTFFIPGSLGAQEGGYTLLLMSFGYSEVTGLTFALIRRLREILWIVIGLGCLMLLQGKNFTGTSEPTSAR